MTTLDFDVSALLRSVAAYPYVHSLSVSTQFPHGVTIDVLEQVPVATVSVGGRSVTVVDGSGEMVPGSAGTPARCRRSRSALRRRRRREHPDSDADRITAPGRWRRCGCWPPRRTASSRTSRAPTGPPPTGWSFKLRDGPRLYFGPQVTLVAKWNAALAVLAARGSAAAAGAQYIDVSDPAEPVGWRADLPDARPKHRP